MFNKDKINTLETQVTTLETENKTLKDEVKNLTGIVSKLEDKLEELTLKVMNQSFALDNFKQTINDFNQKMNATNSLNEMVKSAIPNLKDVFNSENNDGVDFNKMQDILDQSKNLLDLFTAPVGKKEEKTEQPDKTEQTTTSATKKIN